VIENTKEFIELMFRSDLDEDVIIELNPLTETEFFYEDEWGIWTSSKYLSFNFKRIIENNEINYLIVTTRDVTEKVLLTKKVQHIEEHTKKQMEWLVNILHVEPEMLKEFFIGVEHELSVIEEVLKNAKDSKNHRELIEKIYRCLFIIKGNASLLDLRFFTDKTTQFIEKLIRLKSKTDLSGTDFVPIVVSLGDMREILREVKTIFKRISHFHNHFRVKRAYESELLVHSLKSLISNLSVQLGKKINFDYKEFDALAIPYAYRQMVRDILFLLVRNAVLYGIEDQAQRLSTNKPPKAMIKISSAINNGFLGLVLKHDGRIERIERIIQKLVTYQPNERLPDNSIEGIQVTQLLFMPNLKIDDEREIIESYSMDMELLKRKLRDRGGRLKITFTSEDCCEFKVLLPLKKN
jgi:chemotaxis protein histidine kinase CheA